ncbi:hypothetical protein [Pseudokineococcus sp. 1T1Z-3]|uniref:hypothetical protein n=1 Tax=Pseudokineococcus sp. 1T1Z-3 TaxID=3132745 RepID=UPI0030A1AEEF
MEIWPVAAALLPSIGVCALFVYVVRKMVAADRNERAALARLDAAERRDDQGSPAPTTSSGDEHPSS